MKKILTLFFALLASPVAAQVIPSGSWGSINYWGVGGLSQVLSPGLAGQCLQTQGVGSAPIWATCFAIPPQNANTILANVTTNFVAPQAVDINRVLDTVGYDIARPPAVESILYKSNVGPTFNWQTLPPGTTGAVLTSGGAMNPPFWTSPTQASLASVCQTVGAVLYFDTPSLLWKCLAPGTSGQLLQTGGAGANPLWFTVTPASVGAVPSTRNVNTSAPLGGGGVLSADLTLTCATCATTTNGGALSATAPETISAAGVIACATCATTTNGGAISGTSPISVSAGGAISITSPLPIANGGTASSTASTAIAALMPTPTRAGDVVFWNGSIWTTLAGNNSGTQVLAENASGVPAWSAAGAGTVTSVTCGTGLSGGTFSTSGTCAVNAAAKSDQTTATSNVVAVAPLHQQEHPSAVKAYGFCLFTGGTSYTLNNAYNISGGTCGRTGVGTFVITFTTAFTSTTTYHCGAGTYNNNPGSASGASSSTTQATFTTFNAAGSAVEVSWQFECFGTQ